MSAASTASRIHTQLWQADQLGHATVAAHPSGFAELDPQLPGGGWPLGMLTELIARNPGVGELRLLIPVLRQLTLERKVVIMLAYLPRDFRKIFICVSMVRSSPK